MPRSGKLHKGGGAILAVENARIGGLAEVVSQSDCPTNQYGGKKKSKKPKKST